MIRVHRTEQANLRYEILIQEAREILSERMWLPIYERGGVDALTKEGIYMSPPPPPRPTSNQIPMSDYIRGT